MSGEKNEAGDEARERKFARACLGSRETPTGALATYRRLVRHNLATVVFRLLPRTRSRMNEAHNDAFDDAFIAFLDEVGPRTHYMRDVIGEFVRWALPGWKKSAVATTLIDLARYEMLLFEVECAPNDADANVVEVGLDRTLVFSNSARVEIFSTNVHEVAENPEDRTPLGERTTSLVLYRDADNDVVEFEVEPLFAEIVSACMRGATLRDALASSAKKMNVDMTESFLARVAESFADLGERSIVLGGAPT